MTDLLVGPRGVFLAGLLSVLSPSVWPLLPFLAAYFICSVWGLQGAPRPSWAAAIREHLLFLAGFLFIFIWLWANESLLGQFFFGHQSWFTFAGGLLFMLLGVLLLKVPIPAPLRALIISVGRPFFSALIGAALAFAWTPYMGPVLGTVVLMGNSQESVWHALGLLLVYGAGFLIPFFALALALSLAFRQVDENSRFVAWMRTAAGIVFLLGGLLMCVGYINKLTAWTPEVFESWVDQLIQWGI